MPKKSYLRLLIPAVLGLIAFFLYWVTNQSLFLIVFAVLAVVSDLVFFINTVDRKNDKK